MFDYRLRIEIRAEQLFSSLDNVFADFELRDGDIVPADRIFAGRGETTYSVELERLNAILAHLSSQLSCLLSLDAILIRFYY